ncbi:MAG: zf-TFIIB domain-containing protein [Synechococcales cyanobacterium T60_A2020_003]|nr:zf-TFIIB domain-containing protein [Synechococcales cyanobacterium T60_A2020_003]
MLCPKDRRFELVASTLAGEMAVHSCPDCKGTWIPADEYTTWQQRHPHSLSDALPTLEVDYVQSPFDMKAALCPECNRYLARAKVALKTPFYVERCPNCQGIWCDRGEWDTLEQMGLHFAIEQLFSSEWQTRIKEIEYAQRERQATIEKLGEEVAAKVFELAELLEDHPNGDFGVAYLMRRFDK